MWALMREISAFAVESSSFDFCSPSRATDSSWLATTSSWFFATAFSNVETSRLSTCCRPALTRNFCPASVTSSMAAAPSSADSSGVASSDCIRPRRYSGS